MWWGEIHGAFFDGGKTGSLYNTAPPIWQELNFQSCADGTIRKNSGRPLLRSSHMPSQYLYHNGKAMGLDGGLSGSVTPVITGDFEPFGTAFPWGPVDPAGRATAYGDRDSGSGQSGTPWGIGLLDAPGANPDGRFRVDAGLRPDPEFGDRGAAPWSWCTSRGSS